VSDSRICKDCWTKLVTTLERIQILVLLIAVLCSSCSVARKIGSLAGAFTQSTNLNQRPPIASTYSASQSADSLPLRLSHAFIVVTTGAPERKALEKAGFRIAPGVNRHDGQGTASITVELLNGYLELLYPDPTVPVLPSLRVGAEKFRLKSAWRESGYSPIAIIFERTPSTPEKFPFTTWRISPEWMEKGTFMEMLTPREMPKAVSLSIHPPSARESENEILARDPVKGHMFLHPNGARRLSALRVVAPSADAFPPAASYLAGLGLIKFDVGSRWLLEVTLDNGKQRKTRNLEPDLPMVIHY
jgi:Glyoxalase-like domain